MNMTQIRSTLSGLRTLHHGRSGVRLAIVTTVGLCTALVGTSLAFQPPEGQHSAIGVANVPHTAAQHSASGFSHAFDENGNRFVTGFPISAFSVARGDNKEFQKIQKQLGEAKQRLKQAETSDEKEEATEALRTALAADYDARLDEYEQHIDQLEKQLEEMRNKLSKKRDAKREMVSLRLKQVIAEADDLGWPSRVSSSSWNVRTGYSFPAPAVLPNPPAPPKPPAAVKSGKATVWGAASESPKITTGR